MAKAQETEEASGKPRALTTQEVKHLIRSVKIGLRRRMADTREEEPGLSEKSRHFVIKY